MDTVDLISLSDGLSRKKQGQYLVNSIIQAFINLIVLTVFFEITGNKKKNPTIFFFSSFMQVPTIQTNGFKLLYIYFNSTATSRVTS